MSTPRLPQNTVRSLSRAVRQLAPSVALLGLALSSCSSSQTQEVSEEERLDIYRETALYHYELDDLNRAESQALKGLEIDRDDKTLRLMVGWIRLQRGTTNDLTISEGIFREIAREGDDYRAELGLAEALERLGQAHEESARALAEGDAADAPENVATAERLRGRMEELWAESLSLYGRVLAERPSSLKAANGMQRLYLRRGDLESSLAYAEQVLEITTSELSAWEQQLERPNLSSYEEERLRDNRMSSAELELETRLTAAFILRKLGRPQEALSHLDRAIDLAPTRASTYSRRAQVLGELELYARAIEDIEKFLRTSDNPYDHPDIRRAFQLKLDWEARRKLASSGT